MDDIARAFVSFFVIVDPVGNVVVFHLLTSRLSAASRWQVAAISVTAAGGMLIAFSLGGAEVLDFLDISQGAFRTAAGILLLIPAYRLVSQGAYMAVAETETPRPVDIALVPLATPLMAGPGALAAATSFSERIGRGDTIAGIVLVVAVSFLTFVAAERIFGFLGESALRLLTRLVGMLLVAIAIEFIIEGLQASFPGWSS